MNNLTVSNEFFSTPFLLGSVGAPFVIGMAVGYFAKKMFKTALFIGGGLIVLLFVGEYYGVIQVNNAQLEHAADAAIDAAVSSSDYLVHRLSSITSKGLSASAGFYAGFKIA